MFLLNHTSLKEHEAFKFVGFMRGDCVYFVYFLYLLTCYLAVA